MENNAKFISIEGIDGSGKSSVCEFIHSYLLENQINHVITKEIGGTLIGQHIKDVILKSKNLTNKTELLLFLADRSQHLHDIIIPNLNKGNWVITDRFTDSTIAYQGYGNKYFIPFIDKAIKALEFNHFIPDLTILLDVPIDVAIERIKNRKNNNSFDMKDFDFFSRVRVGYLELSLIHHKRIKVVNANQDFELVCAKVKELINGVM